MIRKSIIIQYKCWLFDFYLIWTTWGVWNRQNIRAGSTNDLPTSPAISEMMVLWLYSYIIKFESQIWQNTYFKEQNHFMRYFVRVLLPKWPWEPCDHFMVLMTNAFYNGKYMSNLCFLGGAPICWFTVELIYFCMSNFFGIVFLYFHISIYRKGRCWLACWRG